MTRETTRWMEEVLGLRRTRVQKDPNSSVCQLRRGTRNSVEYPFPRCFFSLSFLSFLEDCETFFFF